MEDYSHSNRRPRPQPNYQNAAPHAQYGTTSRTNYHTASEFMVPRPQYGSARRTNNQVPAQINVPRARYDNPGRPYLQGQMHTDHPPRYFSSPFRAPLNQQERRNSYAAHRRTLSTSHDIDNGRAIQQYPAKEDSTSYTFFESDSKTTDDQTAEPIRPESPTNTSADNVSQSSGNQPNVVRKASIGHRMKPSLTDVRRSDSTETSRPYTEPKTPPPRADTIDALNAAIAAAIKSNAQSPSTHSMLQNAIAAYNRPDSQTSTYSQDVYNSRKSHPRASTLAIGTQRASPVPEEFHTPLTERHGRSSPLPQPTPYSEKSATSTKPLLEEKADTRGSLHNRPSRSNTEAVENVNSRASITSLPDLIRRATKLAANLDRGKTASRLGFWDIFSNTDHANTKKRDSAYSDALDAFPDPASGTLAKGAHSSTMWPSESKENMVAAEQGGATTPKATRKCCGLSVTTFIFVAVIVLLLIIAAVLIPVFLVFVARHNAISKPSVSNCATTFPCQNNGISVVSNDTCSCICVNGFTGTSCSNAANLHCVTANLADGSQKYQNVTLGSSINPLLQNAQTKMNIPLNTSVLLSVFANNNMTCADENSLVQIDMGQRRRYKRFLIVPGLEPDIHPNSDPAGLSPALLFPRQYSIETGVQTVYMTVYQGTVNQISTASIATNLETTAASIVATAPTTSTITMQTTTIATPISILPLATSQAAPLATSKVNITLDQLEFAQLVVLYVLAESRAPITAMVAQNSLEQFLQAGALSSGNKTVNVAEIDGKEVIANFRDFTITSGDGEVVGGQ